jgi:hypothetical protein
MQSHQFNPLTKKLPWDLGSNSYQMIFYINKTHPTRKKAQFKTIFQQNYMFFSGFFQDFDFLNLSHGKNGNAFQKMLKAGPQIS